MGLKSTAGVCQPRNRWRFDTVADPIVQQVRAVRKEIEQQYPDGTAFYKHLEQEQETYRKRLVRRRPKQAQRAQAS